MGRLVRARKTHHPRWDSNPQSSAPETDALSIWPLGQMPEVGFEPTRTTSPADLKSAPLDLSGIQALSNCKVIVTDQFWGVGAPCKGDRKKKRSYRDLNPDRRIQSPE